MTEQEVAEARAPKEQLTEILPVAPPSHRAAPPAPFDWSSSGSASSTLHPSTPHSSTNQPSTNPPAPTEPVNVPLDALFQDESFREQGDPRPLPFLPKTVSAPGGAAASWGTAASGHLPLNPIQKNLVWVVGALVVVLVLLAFFLLGTRLGDQATSSAAARASASASASAKATPTPTTVPTGAVAGPVAPGVYAWGSLLGGECLSSFTSAWAEKFTVVDCGGTHVAQLLARGQLPEAAGSAYPGAASLQTEITALCSVPSVLNYSVAGAVNDIQISSSFPATTAEWSKGDRTYYCFVNRSGGGALAGNLTVAAG
jgi:hypothetical protein